MARFRYNGEVPAHVPDLLREVQPGEVFDTDVPINNPIFTPIDSASKTTRTEEAPA